MRMTENKFKAALRSGQIQYGPLCQYDLRHLPLII